MLIGVFAVDLQSQTTDYATVFGKDWDKANSFLNENRDWMEPLLEKNHIPYNLAVSVIFPELVRYSALRDKMEITLLKALYINLGEEYANFSVGQFQIKPSFADRVRQEAPSVMKRRSGISFKSAASFDDITNYRKSIITDLEDAKTEFCYVIAFIKICEKKYRDEKKDDLSWLKFLSTAYNYGIDKSAEQIEQMADRRFFSTKLFGSTTYSYSDVSLYWYSHCSR